MTHQNQKNRPTFKRLSVIAAVIVILCTLGMIASATGLLDACIALLVPAKEPSPGLVDAVGDGISTEKPDMGPFTPPNMDRPDTDKETVLRLVGDYVCEVGTELTVLQNHLVFHDFIIDENGAGIPTYSVSNPKGVYFTDNGYGEVTFHDMPHPSFHFEASSGETIGSRDFLVSGSSGDPTVEIATYFACFAPCSSEDTLVFSVPYSEIDENNKLINKHVTLAFRPICFAPVNTSKDASGNTISISPVSVLISWNTPDAPHMNELVIHYTDGTEYVVESESRKISNTNYGILRSPDAGNPETLLCFNRLAETNRIADLTLEYGKTDIAAPNPPKTEDPESTLPDRCTGVLNSAQTPTQVFVDAVGDGISTKKANTDSFTPPTMERVKTNAEAVMRLAGDSLYKVDGEFAVNGHTLTFHDFILDENGTGILTYSVSNPNGVYFVNNGYGNITFDYLRRPCVGIKDDIYQEAFSHNFLVSGSRGDQTIEMATYFTLKNPLAPGDVLEFLIRYTETDENNNILEKKASISLAPVSLAPSKAFTDAEGNTVFVSPLSVLIDWHYKNELFIQEFVIHYADGTEYIEKSSSKSLYNTNLEAIRSDEMPWAYYLDAFNRLVDVNAISSITITYHTRDLNGEEIIGNRTYLP